jgi:hypothetical protein
MQKGDTIADILFSVDIDRKKIKRFYLLIEKVFKSFQVKIILGTG